MQRSVVDRLACVNVSAFPLQLLVRRHPEWSAHPAAVVTQDTPQGFILWVNERARQAGVLPGLRYTAGQSLIADLRAGTVPPAEIDAEVMALTERLLHFTPEVEPFAEEPGVFWLNATGLRLLYPSLDRWARAIHADLCTAGFSTTVIVGFTRFGTYAVAKVRTGTTVLRDPARERAAARRVPLDALIRDPDLRDALLRLGIRTVGALLGLPAGGLLERFGPEAHRLSQWAAGELWTPLQPREVEAPIEQRLVLDDPETDRTRLLFLIKRLLDPLLATLAVRGEALAELILHLLLDRHVWRTERLRPAAPTLDERQVLDLVRLHLESVKLSAGVVEIRLTGEGVAATPEQLRLFAEQPRRDLAAANRALARLRAEFGEEAVVRARLLDGHLPEASFTWEPLGEVTPPRPKEVALRSLVRRVLAEPVPFPLGSRRADDNGRVSIESQDGAITRLHGPYAISGCWWMGEASRDYYFAETRRGELLWVYYDHRRRRWFLQGRVE